MQGSVVNWGARGGVGWGRMSSALHTWAERGCPPQLSGSRASEGLEAAATKLPPVSGAVKKLGWGGVQGRSHDSTGPPWGHHGLQTPTPGNRPSLVPGGRAGMSHLLC